MFSERHAGGVLAVIDRGTSPADIPRITFNRQAADAGHAHLRILQLHGVESALSLVPTYAAVTGSAVSDLQTWVIARVGAGLILISAFDGSAAISVAAASDEDAESIATRVRALAPRPEPLPPDTVPIRIWHARSGDYIPRSRTIDAPHWSDIRRNYDLRSREAIDQLIAVREPLSSGKLILWHGPPGTGKTTALRALLRAWAPWCMAEYIVDPERLFAEPGYISDVLTRPTGFDIISPRPTTGTPAWRVLIAEDCDEYLHLGRGDTRPSLGRLLNLSDGVLGQGVKLLILVTTNENLGRLHPALIRPGRCLARIAFPNLSPAQARDWLPPGVERPAGPASLAELFERSGHTEHIGTDPTDDNRIGHYL